MCPPALNFQVSGLKSQVSPIAAWTGHKVERPDPRAFFQGKRAEVSPLHLFPRPQPGLSISDRHQCAVAAVFYPRREPDDIRSAALDPPPTAAPPFHKI